ncbi:MAG: hypothetical protein GY711_14830 [bacterium]|nr:hypothetical protein [bacterium]
MNRSRPLLSLAWAITTLTVSAGALSAGETVPFTITNHTGQAVDQLKICAGSKVTDASAINTSGLDMLPTVQGSTVTYNGGPIMSGETVSGQIKVNGDKTKKIEGYVWVANGQVLGTSVVIRNLPKKDRTPHKAKIKFSQPVSVVNVRHPGGWTVTDPDPIPANGIQCITIEGGELADTTTLELEAYHPGNGTKIEVKNWQWFDNVGTDERKAGSGQMMYCFNDSGGSANMLTLTANLPIDEIAPAIPAPFTTVTGLGTTVVTLSGGVVASESAAGTEFGEIRPLTDDETPVDFVVDLSWSGNGHGVWSESFDDYDDGAVVDPVGQASIGNSWEAYEFALGSSTVSDAQALSVPHSLSNNPDADTVANWGFETATSGRWNFSGHVYHPSAFTGRAYWIMLNTYDFGGPYAWSVQTFFDGDMNLADCDCSNMNDPSGPQVLVRDAWTPIQAAIDLDNDTVDVFYNGSSLTGGQGYSWTQGVFGGSSGVLDIQALELYPDVPGSPNTTESYYDDLVLAPETGELGSDDSQCTVLPNSTGLPSVSVLTGTGVAGDDITAVVSQGPPGGFGYYVSGPNPGLYIVPPGSNGIICIGGPQSRYNSASLGQVFQFDAGGVSHPVIDGGAGDVILTTDGSQQVPVVNPGDSRAFQAWYRDGAASNFSNSRIVQF